MKAGSRAGITADRPVKPIRAVLFDLGDTLVSGWGPRWVWRTAAEVHAYLRQEGVRTPWALMAWTALRVYLGARRRERQAERDPRAADLVAEFVARSGLDPAGATRPVLNIVYRNLDAASFVIPGARETLLRLANLGLRLGLISNGSYSREFVQRLLARHQLDLFRVVLVSSDFGKRKPAPEIFLAGCRALEVEPCEALFVGDREETDIVGARAAGLRAVHFAPNGRGSPRAHRVIQQLADLPLVVAPLLAGFGSGLRETGGSSP